MSVVLRGESAAGRQPVGLIVSVDGQDGYEGRQFAFAPNTQIPGHYTTFLVRLGLPAGQHHVTHLCGVGSDGVPTREFDVVLDLAFEARPKAADYLGHLEFTAAAASPATGASLVLADAYEDDLPNFVHSYSFLRGRSVGRRAPAALVSVPARLREHTDADQGSGTHQTVPALEGSAADALPAPARASFRLFLNKPAPRAFAVSDGGHSGMASGGVDVIERALRNCRRAAGTGERSGCMLFAVDDTLVPPVRGGAAVPSQRVR